MDVDELGGAGLNGAVTRIRRGRHAAIVANPATIAATALMITAASWIQSAAFTA
jgi:hypothetical protein